MRRAPRARPTTTTKTINEREGIMIVKPTTITQVWLME